VAAATGAAIIQRAGYAARTTSAGCSQRAAVSTAAELAVARSAILAASAESDAVARTGDGRECRARRWRK
jgi:hypothetical protein